MISDSVLSQISKPVRFARRHGLVRASYFLVNGTISRFGLEKWIRFCISDIFFSRVSDLPEDCRIPKAFHLTLATENDVPALESFGRKPEHVRARLREGHLCLLLWLGSELKAVEWIAMGLSEFWEDWNELRVIVRIPAGCCWAYDGRGQTPGAWGLLMRLLPKELERNGLHAIYLRVNYANPISWRSHRSAGYSPVARIFHLGVGSLGLTLYRDDQGIWHSLPARVRALELTTPSNQKANQQFKLFPMYRKW